MTRQGKEMPRAERRQVKRENVRKHRVHNRGVKAIQAAKEARRT